MIVIAYQINSRVYGWVISKVRELRKNFTVWGKITRQLMFYGVISIIQLKKSLMKKGNLLPCFQEYWDLSSYMTIKGSLIQNEFVVTWGVSFLLKLETYVYEFLLWYNINLS